jgi:hypothetical protein
MSHLAVPNILIFNPVGTVLVNCLIMVASVIYLHHDLRQHESLEIHPTSHSVYRVEKIL